MTLMSILKGKESPKNLSMLREMDSLGADANSKLNGLVKDSPGQIDHLSQSYPKSFPKEMNGETKGISVKQIYSDEYCQILEMSFGPYSFSPSHTHPHYCIGEVIEGEIFDASRGNVRYDKGDWYCFDPDVIHSEQSVNGALVRIYNTRYKNVADAIIRDKKYDISMHTKEPLSKVKFHQV